ncbi:ROK family protein [Nonomuraea candida]|uniref:ROK family protein n=1 Tax=Nonomuraea candida TaxID=359159 RepID=UPI0005B9FCB9|nr:ROK family protein [Nonomuraea candida]
MEYVVAVDVGGTTMKGGFVAHDGTILHVERRPTPRSGGPERVIAAVASFVADLAATSPPATSPPATSPPATSPPATSPPATSPHGGGRPAAVGLVVPGLVTPTHAVFSAAFGWRDVPVSAFAAVDLPVALGHDVRAAGEAELAFGRSGDAAGDAAGYAAGEHVLYLPIGTGIAGAVVLSGALYGGAGGWAGQIGHIPVWPDGLACGCGQRGCLGAYAGGAAIAARCGADGAEEVARRVLAGDSRAVEVWQEAVEALAVALATYTLLLDPAAIVIGGGVSRAGETLLAPLRERLAGRLAFRAAPEVRASPLGPDAGLLGAALLARRAAAAA